MKFFHTSQVISVVDPRTLAPLLDHPSVYYEIVARPLRELEGRRVCPDFR